MFNNIGFLWVLDEYIIYYKYNVLECVLNDFIINKITYDDYYKSSERSIYFNLMKYYNQVYNNILNLI